MPAASDILQFMREQLFQTPTLPDTNLEGRTIVITGANTGLGFECAKQLASLHASTIVLGCRDIGKGEAARKQILKAASGTSTTIHVWPVDMCSFDSVKAFVERVRIELPRLDGLIANAGISMKDYTAAEHFESTLTVNVISTFLLALLVLPILEQSALANGGPTRLTITGSVVHCFAAHDQLVKPPQGKVFAMLSEESTADMAARYFLSKLMVLQCVQELAQRRSNTTKDGRPTVIVNCPNPGWCKTGLFRNDDGGFWGRNLLKLIGRTSEEGARTLTDAIVAGEHTHGRYLSNCQIKPASAFVRSDEGLLVQVKVWQELMDILDTIVPGLTESVRRA